MKTRTYIAALVSMMANAVVFGVGALLVLYVPALEAHAAVLLPIVIVAAFVTTPFIGWKLAPRMRARNWRDGEYAPARSR
ncbi:hypothetical protein [Amorphus orientalis]|uniref:ABC-type sulfate transport system permease subunit n=1 Tax=Amorphus orientalis TaxID=649198 RepID=A0AAE3VKR3_9HYPH|nr:hypothetical protein [Amorphus orientalis]MDQ0313846.1 ABC-type sulfate transport system permease subunit [Amorphus orientalis]